MAICAVQLSIIAAHEYFDVPRTTINRWLADGYFERNTMRRSRGNNKWGAGTPITYEAEIDGQLLLAFGCM